MAGTMSFDVFFGKNPFRGVGCSELQEPKKALKTSPQCYGKSRIRDQKPLKGARQNLACRVMFTTLSPTPILVKIG